MSHDHLSVRPRRLRQTPWLRDLVSEITLAPKDFILPLFLRDKTDDALDHLGIRRYTVKEVYPVLEKAADLGIKAVMFFPVIANAYKDETASYAFSSENFFIENLHYIKQKKYPLTLLVDVALDPYTSHGHDGLLVKKTDGDFEIDNDETINLLVEMSFLYAKAGIDGVCPSDMMDGRVAFIRKKLDQEKLFHVCVMSYALKYASCLYRPFRSIVNAQPLQGLHDKKTYQMDFRNKIEGLREMHLDISEGADMLIVKPGLFYLDQVARLSQTQTVPLFVYQVSGEYAMIKAAAQQGLLDEKMAFLEAAYAFKRAGATGIIAYNALEMAKWIKE